MVRGHFVGGVGLACNLDQAVSRHACHTPHEPEKGEDVCSHKVSPCSVLDGLPINPLCPHGDVFVTVV